MAQGTGSQSRMYRGVDTEQRRAERRERLLEAALDEFTSRGYHKTKIADLCARAGVSTRNFINTVAMKRMLPVLDSLVDADALTRITTLVDAFVAAVTSDPRYPRLNYVEAPGISQAMERQHQDWFSRYTDFIEAECDRVVEAGLAPKRDYHLTAIALVGAVTGILREWQSHQPPLPVQDVADEIRAMFMASITRPA